MRAMTLAGLCMFLHCNVTYFNHLEARLEDDSPFREVINNIRVTIYNQKFQGAAAELLNSNIIARELGLADKTEVNNIQHTSSRDFDESKLSDEELHLLDELQRKGRIGEKELS